MKYNFLSTIIIFANLIIPAFAGYFVKLKKSSTLESLLNSDDKIKALHHLRPYITKEISFGNFEGFSGNFTKDLIQRLIKNPLVADIVPDMIVKAVEEEEAVDVLLNSTQTAAITVPTANDGDMVIDSKDFDPIKFDADYLTQPNAPRHLARLSRRGRLPINESLNYYFDASFQGNNVFAYVIDTGIQTEHPDFSGRVIKGVDFTNEGSGDLNGHGTHVAGVIGSDTYGVAKNITLVEVKSLNFKGQGSLTTVLSGLEFAVNDRKTRNVKGLANLSLGSTRNQILNDAIEEAFNSGLIVTVAAGNSNVDACNTSPGSSTFAITVGAIDDITDSVAHFSNWGPCVNIFASGVYVRSLSNRFVNGYSELTGTSMSSPSIAGLTAILLEQGVEIENINSRLIEMSTSDQIIMKPTAAASPNNLAFNDVKHDDDEFPPEDFPAVDLSRLNSSTQFRKNVSNKDLKPQTVGQIETGDALAPDSVDDVLNPMVFKRKRRV